MDTALWSVVEDVQSNFVAPVVANGTVVAASFTFWLSLQLFLDYGFPALFPALTEQILSSSSKDNWGNIRTRVMGTVYGLYASISAGYALMQCDPSLQSNLYGQDDFIHTYLVAVAVGWFIWDIIDCLRHPEWGLLFQVHGFVALGIFAACLKPFLQHTAAIVLLYEASTPLMHLRKTLLTFGYAKKYPTFFIGVTAAFFVVFFSTRIAVGLWATAIWWSDILTLVQGGLQHSSLVVGFMMASNLIMNAMNLYWFSQMLAVFVSGVGLKSIAKADEKQH